MDRLQRAASLQLDKHPVLEEQVRAELADHVAAVAHGDRDLSLHRNAPSRQRDDHRSLVHRFEKAMPELAVNVIERPDKRRREVFVEH